MSDPQSLDAMAVRCKRLADETDNRQDRAALEDLAQDYARRADEARRSHAARVSRSLDPSFRANQGL